MAIVIVVEDGSGKQDANSYSSVDEVKQYLTDRGITVVSDEQLAIKLIQACDWLECQGSYKGKRVSDEQALAYPRTGVFVNGRELPPSVIPRSLKTAHMQLVADTLQSGKPLLEGAQEFALKMRKLGPLTQEWATGSGSQARQKDPHIRVWSLLSDLLIGGGSKQGTIVR